ncbi:hypothetical protein F5Y16DRAFT_421441 [Xylariaceae sp. FL0255]|nr:hypothetical protein F5Y16DRAFT_421441 [Xylariaceae sp. FL0255]
MYGVASALIAPIAFSGRLIDVPPNFVLRSFLGFLKLIVAPRTALYRQVLEVAATNIISVLSRLISSIHHGNVFCFAPLAQSAIALILPGFMVVSAALELMSLKDVVGSIRMVWKQIPIILSICVSGWTASKYSYGLFEGKSDISTIVAALIVGLIANFYSRAWYFLNIWDLPSWFKHNTRTFWPHRLPGAIKGRSEEPTGSGESAEEDTPAICGNMDALISSRCGPAAAVMVPAIFVQVPSGVVVGESLLWGVQESNIIKNDDYSGDPQKIGLDIIFAVINVAIGVAVGLYLSALVVYPRGKRKSTLRAF